MEKPSAKSLLTPKKWSAYICYGLSLILLLGCVLTLPGNGFYRNQTVLVQNTGWVALLFFLLSFSATPLIRLLSFFPTGARLRPGLVHIRRSAGITSAAWGLLHGFCVFTVYEGLTVRAALAMPHFQAGFLALTTLIPLWITSFPRLHPRLWKEWHRLTYLTAILILVHLVLSPWSSTLPTLVITLIFLVLFFARWIKPTRPHGNKSKFLKSD